MRRSVQTRVCRAAAPEDVPAATQPRAAASELPLGSPVPDVPLTLQDGFQLQLPAMKGKIIAAFFCTSLQDAACQREAEALSAHYAELHDEHHVVVLGVTPASAATHKRFLSERHSPIDLASDPDGQVARAFGAGPLDDVRMVVVDRKARIHAVWRGADPEAHVRGLLLAARD